ncbi:hypothetical protein PIB30_043485 [Stylosanthes scabra]|uniref:Uncharacterized protein n=1 Tax=Stylosanthes scabra TaxID=79078 RepID=A0ABU6ZEB0_9FABA|nr:hypothetical protein [Stylosanthes scabra]
MDMPMPKPTATIKVLGDRTKRKRQRRIGKKERSKFMMKKGTLSTTSHIQFQLGQSLLDAESHHPNPPAASSHPSAVINNDVFDDGDFILSHDFFCTPDYITLDNQNIFNGLDFNKENTPCPK